MRLDIDTEIRYRTGERAGYLQKVIFDEGGHATEVVLSIPGLIARQVRVPVTALSEGEGGVLNVDLSPEEVHGLPNYAEERVPAAPGEWELGTDASAIGEVFPASTYEPIIPVAEVPNTPEGAFAISHGTEVRCLDGRWGIVDEVIVTELGVTQAFVGRPDDISEPDRLIPIELVQEISAESVTLNCTLADLATYTEALRDEPEEPERF